MRAVIQRVKSSSVRVGNKKVGKIENGLLVFLAIHKKDNTDKIKKLVEKTVNLRVFEDDKEKMNLSVKDIKGSILVISQFTLYGDCKKGNRPSFINSADPQKAKLYYEKAVALLKEKNIHIETGSFGEMMEVSIINDGPVTLIIDV